jgi:hypothetical protein
LALGCTGLTEAGERVRVVDDPREVGGCRFLGEVEGSAMHTKPGQWVGGNALIAETSAANDARNEAGALGADTLLELDTDLEVFEATAKAGAYRCAED